MTSLNDGGEYTIYLIGCPDYPIVKVGRTRNPSRRLSDLSRHFPAPPVILWSVVAITEVETALCRYLGKHGYAAHGREWFDFKGKNPVPIMHEAYYTVGPYGVHVPPGYGYRDPHRAEAQPWETNTKAERVELWLRYWKLHSMHEGYAGPPEPAKDHGGLIPSWFLNPAA